MARAWSAARRSLTPRSADHGDAPTGSPQARPPCTPVAATWLLRRAAVAELTAAARNGSSCARGRGGSRSATPRPSRPEGRCAAPLPPPADARLRTELPAGVGARFIDALEWRWLRLACRVPGRAGPSALCGWWPTRPPPLQRLMLVADSATAPPPRSTSANGSSSTPRSSPSTCIARDWLADGRGRADDPSALPAWAPSPAAVRQLGPIVVGAVLTVRRRS